jgi:hypothetical protein
MSSQQDQQPSTPDLPRQTFIALRARRQAYHVATDLLYHDDPADAAPQPAIPLSRHRRRRAALLPHSTSRMAVVLLAMMALCVIALVAFAIAEGSIQLPRRL